MGLMPVTIGHPEVARDCGLRPAGVDRCFPSHACIMRSLGAILFSPFVKESLG